jgi:hypothetical protein
MALPDGYVSLRRFAELRDVNLSAVQKAIASGRVTSVLRENDTLVGVHQVQGMAEWDANTDPVESARNGRTAATEPGGAIEAPPASSSTPPAPDAPPSSNQTYLDARARREEFEAKSAELAYLKEVGLLVSAAEAREVSYRRYRTLRDKLLNIPDRVSTILAAERDPVTIHRLITDELKRVLNELSDAARSEAAGGDSERLAA